MATQKFNSHESHSHIPFNIIMVNNQTLKRRRETYILVDIDFKDIKELTLLLSKQLLLMERNK